MKFKTQNFLTRASERALFHVRVFALQTEWLFRPPSWDNQRWAQIPVQIGLFRHICHLTVLRQTWPTHPPSVLAELLPAMKILYFYLEITLQKLIRTIIIIMMTMMTNKYQLLVSSTIECSSYKWRVYKAKLHSVIAELQHFGRVLTTPVFSIINVPFVLFVHTRQKIGAITKMRAKTVFQASIAWPNGRNNLLLHVGIFPSTIITSKGQNR